jgi:hypothetical protein
MKPASHASRKLQAPELAIHVDFWDFFLQGRRPLPCDPIITCVQLGHGAGNHRINAGFCVGRERWSTRRRSCSGTVMFNGAMTPVEVVVEK